MIYNLKLVKSAISSPGKLIISSENIFPLTWIFGVNSRPKRRFTSFN